jgi:hypothetical protein
MSRISVKAVLVGSVVDVVMSFLLAIPFVIYGMVKFRPTHTSSGHAATNLAIAMHADVPLYVSQLLVGLACSVFGGYVAARLAKNNELLNAGLSSFLCVLIGIYAISSGKGLGAQWMQIIMLIASPVCAVGGGLLRGLQRSSRHVASV